MAIGAITFACIGMSLLWLFGPGDVFNSPAFTPCEIMNIEAVSPTAFIVTLRPKGFKWTQRATRNITPYHPFWKEGVWAVEFKQPELQIARSYTPLPPLDDYSPLSPSHISALFHKQEAIRLFDLRFLIRVQPDGEVSRYLQRLPVGATVEIRGPQHTAPLQESLEEVLFIAGGTGIAAALQVAHTLLEARDTDKGERKKPFVHIIWANRRREDCNGVVGSELLASSKVNGKGGMVEVNPVVQQLQALQLKHPKNLHVDYTVDEEGTYVDQQTIVHLTGSKSSDISRSAWPQARDVQLPQRMILVSGPEGFVKYVAGPKIWADGEEKQGPVRGLLGQADVVERGWSVLKL